MAETPGARFVNPRLGLYFSIVTSLLVAIVVVLVVLAELGAPRASIGLAIASGPLAVYLVLAGACYSATASDHFSAGRRVPAFFNGLVLGLAALGGTGIVSLTGLLFLIGFDALALFIGITAGLVAMAILIAPFYRKLGASSVAGFLGLRFASPLMRVAAATMLAAPLLMLLVAELRIGAEMLSALTGRRLDVAAAAMAVIVVLIVAPGGLRSQTWSGAAQAIAALLALLVPVTIVALLTTNLPLPQLSHGPILRALGRAEFTHAMPQQTLPALAVNLPGVQLAAFSGRFATPFTAIGGGAFVLLSLIVMAGIAASPALLPRAGAATGIYVARKSHGWAIFVLAVVVTTLSAVAVLLRDLVFAHAVGADPTRIAPWLVSWINLGLAHLDPSQAGAVRPEALAFRRDSVALALPHAAGLPMIMVAITAAGGLAAAMVAATQTAHALAASIADDIVHGLGRGSAPGSDATRILASRIGLVVVAALAGLMVGRLPLDPLQLLIWAVGLVGATAFPVLVLSIWWKRINASGAAAGMTAGFVVTALAMVAGEAGALLLPSALAAAIGIPVSFATAMGVSALASSPTRHELELVRDVRVPGGETIVDRDARLARQSARRGRGR